MTLSMHHFISLYGMTRTYLLFENVLLFQQFTNFSCGFTFETVRQTIFFIDFFFNLHSFERHSDSCSFSPEIFVLAKNNEFLSRNFQMKSLFSFVCGRVVPLRSCRARSIVLTKLTGIGMQATSFIRSTVHRNRTEKTLFQTKFDFVVVDFESTARAQIETEKSTVA